VKGDAGGGAAASVDGFKELANPERYMELHNPNVYQTT